MTRYSRGRDNLRPGTYNVTGASSMGQPSARPDDIQDTVAQAGDVDLTDSDWALLHLEGGFENLELGIGDYGENVEAEFGGPTGRLDHEFNNLHFGMEDGSKSLETDVEINSNGLEPDVGGDLADKILQAEIGLQHAEAQQQVGPTSLRDFVAARVEGPVHTLLLSQSNQRRPSEWELQQVREEARRQSDNRAFHTRQKQLSELGPTTQFDRVPMPSLFLLQNVLRALGDRHGRQAHEMEYYVKLTETSNISPELTSHIMSAPNFARWLGSTHSQMHLINPIDQQPSKVSAGTFFSASLAKSLTKVRPVVTLTYFCRSSMSYAQDCDPAACLMADLVSQLLVRCRHDLRVWEQGASIDDHKKAIKTKDLKYLCDFFRYLVVSLPRCVVFCIIDDFFDLEHRADDQSLNIVIRTLSSLGRTYNTMSSVVVKVLIMTPYSRGRILHSTRRENLLRLPDIQTTEPPPESEMMPEQQVFKMDYFGQKIPGSFV